MTDQALVIGVFEQREAAYKTLQALHQAGFQDDQLGFMTRQEHTQTEQYEQKPQRSANAVVRGIVGGILGAADIFLAPITGPADANLILESTLPVVEEAIDRLPHPHARPESEEAAADTAHPNVTGDTNATTRTQQEQEAPFEQNEVYQHERTSIVTGGVIGGAIGAMGAVGALFIPGIGPIVAGGILAVILGGAGMGSIAGGFLGAFVDIGIPEDKARFYEQELKSGSTIVTVKTGERQQEATHILQEHGAHNIQSH